MFRSLLRPVQRDGRSGSSIFTRRPPFHCAVLCCEAVLTERARLAAPPVSTASTPGQWSAGNMLARRGGLWLWNDAACTHMRPPRRPRRLHGATCDGQRPARRRPPSLSLIDLSSMMLRGQSRAHACACGGPVRAVS